MKKYALFSLVFMLAFVSFAQAADREDDAFCIWSTTVLKKSFGREDRWGAGVLQEYRHKVHDGVSRTDQWFLRPSVSYAALPWLKLQYQVDFASTSSGFNLRFMPEVSFTHREGNFSSSSFSWFQKIRWYAGIDIRLTDTLTLSPHYNCQAYFNHRGSYGRRTYDDHVMYFTLTVKL